MGCCRIKEIMIMNGKEVRVGVRKDYIPPNGINQTFEIALWLPSFADVDSEYERLSKLGVQFPRRTCHLSFWDS